MKIPRGSVQSGGTSGRAGSPSVLLVWEQAKTLDTFLSAEKASSLGYLSGNLRLEEENMPRLSPKRTEGFRWR